MKLSIHQIAAAAALALSSAATMGATLTFQGATFTSSFVGNDLTIQIDAAPSHLTGDWSSALWIDAIEVKNVGSYTSVSMTGTGGAWTYVGAELNANGCAGGNDPAGACFTHTPVSLGDGMSFTFSYVGGPFDFSAPTLKVRFLDSDLKKQGSLLSLPIPEPGTYALMLGGLGLIGFMARRRRDR